jgi:hypothetical protein
MSVQHIDTINRIGSVHVAEPGFRIPLSDLRVINKRQQPISAFTGVLFVYTLVTPSGALFQWRTAKQFAVGNVLSLTATIHAHRTLRGFRYNIITRCGNVVASSSEQEQPTDGQ